MNSRKICVIGSNSFSGSNFVNHALHSDYEVMGISRSSEPDSIFYLINGYKVTGIKKIKKTSFLKNLI